MAGLPLSLALLSGVLLALSFPKFGHPSVAWLALAPLWLAVWQSRRHSSHAFLLGWIAGLAYFGGTLYWLVRVMTVFGGLSTPLAMVVALLLVAYLSLFTGVSAWVVGRATRLGAGGLLIAPAAWVSGELGRTYVWSGFPWALLGYSQVPVLPIAQTASLVGVYGVSMLLALTSAAVTYAFVAPARRRWIPLAATLAAVAVLGAWGAARVRGGTLLRAGTPVRVGVVQGDFSQEEKWDPRLRDTIMQRYLTLSRSALADGATFVLWPESSLPFYFEHDQQGSAAVRRLAREFGATFLVGSDQIEPITLVPAEPAGAARERYYNAAFLVGPDGATAGVYRKMHLVPFGEYVPLKDLLFFVQPIVEAVSDFSPGTEPAILRVGEHLASTAICYEVVYPRLIAGFVSRGSQLLTTITNDAWFGRSSAAYQHWDQAVMRSIEQGRYLARAANTGISGFADPYGRVLDATPLFEPAVRVRELRFLPGRTVYGHIGDLVAYAGLALAALVLLLPAWPPRF